MEIASCVYYGKNLKVIYPNESIQTVKDIPNIIKDYRDLFHYDNGFWYHNENQNIWCNYDRCSQSFSKWLDDEYKNVDSRISRTTIRKSDLKQGDKITGRYGSKSFSKEFADYQEKLGGPDIMTVNEYRIARRISFNTLKEFRVTPKASYHLSDAYDWCVSKESKLGLPHLTLKLNVDICETMVSKEVDFEFKKVYDLVSRIMNKIGKEDDINNCKNELLNMIQSHAKVFEVIDEDFVTYIINK